MWIFILVLVAPCLSRIVESVGELPGLEYDFVVIGGGTAGNVIANRLTEDPHHSVLVLEAGGSHEGALDTQVPLFSSRLAGSQYDWNFTTTPQIGMNGRSIPYPRGRILGGSSSINSMAYTRGSSDDYDRYARLTNDPGWSWAKLLPYFRKNEKWTLPADNHDITGQFDPSVHGFEGINSVSLPGYSHQIELPEEFPYNIDTNSGHHLGMANHNSIELPEEFPYNIDTNSGHHLGMGWAQSTINRGVRSSSATSYLDPQFIKRGNLNVLVHAQVSRVLQTNGRSEKPAFRTVEFTEGPTWRVKAKKEVILSAGTVGTPQILLNSGIGDSPTLSRIGIKPLVHLPSVGRNLSDHTTVSALWVVKATDGFEELGRNATLAADAFRSWNETRTGPLVVAPLGQAGWIRLPANASIFQKFPDPSPGPHTAHFELAVVNGIPGPSYPPTGSFLIVGCALLSPVSRGSITINSTNPFGPPIIDLNFLSSEFDMFTLREAIRSARRFIAAPAWAGYIISRVSNATTDAELDQYIRSSAGTVFHGVGTASMSPKGAKYGVVDPDLRVKGVAGLRVVDASVLPVVPAGHTQAATYVIAERGADLIKEAW